MGSCRGQVGQCAPLCGHGGRSPYLAWADGQGGVDQDNQAGTGRAEAGTRPGELI
jgi:hypothetical protein